MTIEELLRICDETSGGIISMARAVPIVQSLLKSRPPEERDEAFITALTTAGAQAMLQMHEVLKGKTHAEQIELVERARARAAETYPMASHAVNTGADFLLNDLEWQSHKRTN